MIRFCDPSTVLRDASPEEAGLRPGPVEAAVDAVRSAVGATGEGLYPGVVGLMGTGGAVVAREAFGHSRLHHDGRTEVPAGERVRTTVGTVYDLASVSKVLTAIVVISLVERGLLALDALVAPYLPEFAAGGKDAVTVRRLLTHTSGLPAELPLWSAYGDPAARVAAALACPVVAAPGSAHVYSDVGFIALGVLAERVAGRPLDVLVRELVTEPLGMTRTGYRPLEWAPRSEVAATEHQVAPPRGLVWGEVHDESAWALGGVAGHAGVFSTADDLAVLAQALLNGGTYGGRRVLTPESVTAMVTDQGGGHGLGLELDQRWYMDRMASPRTAGHTGYTGTSLVVDLGRQAFAVLLSNRVHPRRSGPSVNPARRAWARGLALAHPTQSRAT